MRYILAIFFFCIGITVKAEGECFLKADGQTDTYKLIEQSGFFAETSGRQTPDDFMFHPDYKHISQLWDEQLQEYVFAFDIHVNYEQDGRLVTDGNKGSLLDRQRNEIKCMSSVPSTVAANGESITYSWKFMLPEGLLTTKEFCHIHQIKGMGDGEEVAHPVFTFTCRSVSSRQVLQIINVPYEGASNLILAQTDLKPLLGKWLEAVETVTVGKEGKYQLSLTDIESGDIILEVNESEIEVWRDTDDNSTMRGKWGIYRSLGSDLELLKDLRSERLLFADFKTSKRETGINEIYVSHHEGDDAFYDLFGRKVKNPTRGIYIRKGKKIIIN